MRLCQRACWNERPRPVWCWARGDIFAIWPPNHFTFWGISGIFHNTFFSHLRLFFSEAFLPSSDVSVFKWKTWTKTGRKHTFSGSDGMGVQHGREQKKSDLTATVTAGSKEQVWYLSYMYDISFFTFFSVQNCLPSTATLKLHWALESQGWWTGQHLMASSGPTSVPVKSTSLHSHSGVICMHVKAPCCWLLFITLIETAGPQSKFSQHVSEHVIWR